MSVARIGSLCVVWVLASTGLLGQTGSSVLGSLASDDLSAVPGACECELYRERPGSKDFYAAARIPENRVFETRRERSAGFARVLGELLTMDLEDRKDGDCRRGSSRVERWKAGSATVVLDLRVIRAGAEACWYRGRLRVTAGKRSETVRVVGACGC